MIKCSHKPQKGTMYLLKGVTNGNFHGTMTAVGDKGKHH